MLTTHNPTSAVPASPQTITQTRLLYWWSSKP